MRMTRADMRTELQATGFGNSTAEVIRQNNWLDAAYLWVWNAVTPAGTPVRWSFETVDQAALAVVAGVSTPTMPSDFGRVDHIDDNLGSELKELDPETFDLTFAPGVVSGATGAPWAYKVVNRQVTLGPIPDTSSTFRISYTRRVSHYDTGGNAVGGTFTTDTDYPLWPDHHMPVVYHAALVGHSANSNPFGLAFQGLRDDAIRQMRADLQVEAAPGEIWGARSRTGYPARRASGWW